MIDLIAIIVSLACIVSIVAIGNAALEKLNKTHKPKTKAPWYEELSYSTGIGLVLLTTWAFIINFFGYGYWYLLALPIFLGIIVAAKNTPKFLHDAKEVKKNILSSSSVVKITCAFFAILFLIGFLIALAPPSANQPGPTDQDSLNYHLVIPKFYLSQHSLEQIPFLAYDNWPHSIETFYIIPMSIGGVSAVKLTMLFVSLALLLALFAFARRFVKIEHALLAPIIFASSPVVFLSLGSAYIDLALTFFVVLAIMNLHSWTLDKKWQDLMLIGVFAGFAASVKLSGAIQLFLIALLLVFLSLKEKNKLFAMIQLKHFALPALVLALPWLIRNAANNATLNPIFPLYSAPLQILGISPAGTEYVMSHWTQGAAASGGGINLFNFLLLPWNLTMHGNLFNGIISPLFLAFAPLFLLILLRKETTMFEKILVAFSFAYTIIWFLTYQEARFYEPVLAISTVLLAITISRFPSVESICRKTALVVATVAVVIMFFYSVTAFPVSLGFEEKEIYLNRTLNTYSSCQFINENADVQQVLFYKIEAAFYCSKPFAYTFSYDADTAETKEKLIEQLKRDGFTHALVYVDRATGSMAQFINGSQPIYTSSELALYQIPT